MERASGALLVECQKVLAMTQTEFGALIGKDRRTIHRWQTKGALLLLDEATALAAALRSTRPDLADQVLALGRASADAAGQPMPVTSDVVDAILKAAADSIGVSPATIRPAVLAALETLAESKVSVDELIAALESTS